MLYPNLHGASRGGAPVALDEKVPGGTARLPQLSAGLKARFGTDKLQQYRNFHSVVGGLGEHAQRLVAG
jgi:hypothetical protein